MRIAAISGVKIDVNRNEQIEHWARRFGVTRARLITAVAAAGPDIDRVEAWLTRKPREHDMQGASRALGSHAYD